MYYSKKLIYMPTENAIIHIFFVYLTNKDLIEVFENCIFNRIVNLIYLCLFKIQPV